MQKMQPIAIYRGKVSEELGFRTAMNKQPIFGPIFLGENGLEGDEVAELKFHGGPDRALLHYPSEHYAYWLTRFSLDETCRAPSMGENISTIGMTEENVFIGDRYQWGEAIIEVSQPRSPCYKLNRRWGTDSFSVIMQELSLCGWLYRVISPGQVSAEDALILMERPASPISVKDLCRLYFGDPLNREGLTAILAQTKLSESWTQKVIQRLETRQVENWNFRLLGRP